MECFRDARPVPNSICVRGICLYGTSPIVGAACFGDLNCCPDVDRSIHGLPHYE